MKKIPIGLLMSAVLITCLYSFSNKQESLGTIKYSCLPCGSGCDSAVFDKPGTCRHCSMKLVDRSTIVHKDIEPDKICLLIMRRMLYFLMKHAGRYECLESTGKEK